MKKQTKDKILGIIPARYGSTRFPGKPLAPLLDKTLIQHTYENAKKCKALTELVVATDDSRIFDHVRSFGGNVIMTSVNCPTGTDRLAEVLLLNPDLAVFPYIVNIQGDEPCINPNVIEQVIEVLIADSNAQMSTAVVKIESEEDARNSAIVKCVFDKNGKALFFSRSLIPGNKQGQFHSNVSYYRHLGIYGYERKFLLEYARLAPTALQLTEDLEQLKALEHGYCIKVAVVHEEGIGVDHFEDIKKVESILCKANSYL